jgi:hypothetical protein
LPYAHAEGSPGCDTPKPNNPAKPLAFKKNLLFILGFRTSVNHLASHFDPAGVRLRQCVTARFSGVSMPRSLRSLAIEDIIPAFRIENLNH